MPCGIKSAMVVETMETFFSFPDLARFVVRVHLHQVTGATALPLYAGFGQWFMFAARAGQVTGSPLVYCRSVAFYYGLVNSIGKDLRAVTQ